MAQPNIITMSAGLFWVLCSLWGISICVAFGAGVAFWHKHSADIRAKEQSSPQSALQNTPVAQRKTRRVRDA